MNTVTIFNNAIDSKDYETHEHIDDVCALLASKYPVFPETAKIYHELVCEANNVTPHCEAEITHLQTLTGNFFVVIWPEDPITIGIIVAIALAAVSIGLSFLMRPTTKTADNTSPNNEVGNRENKARPNARIPDIVGTVRSTPDLLALPYKIFIDNQEFEICYLGIGRGHYTIIDCQDDQTPVDEINGEYVAVYPPNNSPNSTTPAPQATFGTAPPVIPKIVSVQQSNAVNGQVIRPSNAGYLEVKNDVSFGYGGTLNATGGSLDFTDYFIPSRTGYPSYLQIYTNDDGINASDPAQHVHSVGLAGIYQILSVSSSQVILSNPASINPNWNKLATFSGQVSAANHTFIITSNTTLADGPYILNVKNMTEVWANFVAEQGLYYVDSAGHQKSLTITIQLTAQAINSALQPIGDPITATVNVVGSASNHNICGATLKMILPTPGPVMVTVLRTTPQFIYHSNLAMVDQIQWRDLFAVSAVSTINGDFGDITTALAITAQTQDALSIKSRKLNLLVTRNLPTWINRTAPGTPQFSTALYPTNNAADIICALAFDTAIGRRQINELNVADIYAIADASYLGGAHTNGAIATYFGTFLMTEFCYTFDDAKTSFEESLGYIAQAINCICYRSASTIDLYFEYKNPNSTLLFNHRNKIPNSESRTVSFGVLNDNDGVQYDYIDPNAPNYPDDDVSLTLYYPPSETAISPKSIKSIGVRNLVQATINGWRLYLKIIYANTQTIFSATQEAALTILSQRILVADNTRTGVQDGEIIGQSGLTVTTSQPLVFGSGAHTVFIQHYDETIESISVTAGPQPNQMVLATAPTLPLVVDPSMFARTTYIMVANASTIRPLPFLVTQKDPQDNNTFKIAAINYTDNYYDHDLDFIDGIVLAPPTGFGPQGYIGHGTRSLGGSTIPSTRLGFNASTYTGSALQTTNNPVAPVTASPIVYINGASNLVPDSDLRWQTNTNPMAMSYWSNPGPEWQCGLGAGNNGMNAFIVSSAASGTSEGSVSTVFSVTPGQQYSLSGFMDATGVTAGSLAMSVYDASLTNLYADLLMPAGSAGVSSTSFVCPAGVTQMVVVCGINGATIASALSAIFSTPMLQTGSVSTTYVSGPLDVTGSMPYHILPTPVRSAIFDDGTVQNLGGVPAPSITPISGLMPSQPGADVTAQNTDILLQNPNFIAGNVGWNAQTGWSIVAGAGYNGSPNYARYAGLSTASIGNKQLIPCSAGAVISAGCFFNGTVGTTGSTVVRVNFCNSSGAVLSSSSGNSTTANALWNQSRVVGTAPTGTAYAAIDCAIFSQTAGIWSVGGFTASILANSLAEIPDGPGRYAAIETGADKTLNHVLTTRDSYQVSSPPDSNAAGLAQMPGLSWDVISNGPSDVFNIFATALFSATLTQIPMALVGIVDGVIATSFGYGEAFCATTLPYRATVNFFGSTTGLTAGAHNITIYCFNPYYPNNPPSLYLAFGTTGYPTYGIIQQISS